MGSIVKVTHSFESNGMINNVMLPIGECGEVQKIDEEGDALIAFDSGILNWVFQQNFFNLHVEERHNPKHAPYTRPHTSELAGVLLVSLHPRLPFPRR